MMEGWQLGEHGEWDKHTNFDLARRSSAEHRFATKALRCTATAWMLTAAESFAKF